MNSWMETDDCPVEWSLHGRGIHIAQFNCAILVTLDSYEGALWSRTLAGVSVIMPFHDISTAHFQPAMPDVRCLTSVQVM